jgi:hypothetical protein
MRKSTFIPVNDGKFGILHTEDVEPLLDSLKEERNSNQGSHLKSQARWRKVGEIPMIIVEKWLREDGFNALAPGNEKETLNRVQRDYPYLLAVDKV